MVEAEAMRVEAEAVKIVQLLHHCFMRVMKKQLATFHVETQRIMLNLIASLESLLTTVEVPYHIIYKS
jgi:hypothetical protein